MANSSVEISDTTAMAAKADKDMANVAPSAVAALVGKVLFAEAFGDTPVPVGLVLRPVEAGSTIYTLVLTTLE